MTKDRGGIAYLVYVIAVTSEKQHYMTMVFRVSREVHWLPLHSTLVPKNQQCISAVAFVLYVQFRGVTRLDHHIGVNHLLPEFAPKMFCSPGKAL